MDDLTVLMLTPNLVPPLWAAYHREMLEKAIGDTPIITISAKPLNWGMNLIQTEYGLTNIYRQMLRGAKLATTPYIAMADDDTLYPAEHYRVRPPLGTFGYNLNRWHIFSYGRRRPFYFHKPRPGNGLLIAERELVVKAIEARFARYPDELPGFLLREMGSRIRARDFDNGTLHTFYTYEPVVSFYHQDSVDDLVRRGKKRSWPVRAYDIPTWGKAEELREMFQ